MTTSRSSSWLEVAPSHMLAANEDAFHDSALLSKFTEEGHSST